MPNIDGINKIKKGDVKKSRNIVLSAIEKHDSDLQQDKLQARPKKKLVNVDGIKQLISKKSQVTEKEKQINLIKKDSSKPFLGGMDGIVREKKVVYKMEKVQKVEKDEQKIKKVSKAKRDAWLSEMKGVLGSEAKTVKEDEYKIKKFIRQDDKKIKAVSSVRQEKDEVKKKVKLFSQAFFKREKKVVVEPEVVKVKKEVIEPVAVKAKKEVAKLSAPKLKEKSEAKKKIEDFEYDLTPALSKKRHKAETDKIESKKVVKKGFFTKLQEKKQEKKLKKAEKEKLILENKKKLSLEKQENKKKIQEKEDELRKAREEAEAKKEKKKLKKKKDRRVKREKRIATFQVDAKKVFYNFVSICKSATKLVPILSLMVLSTALFCYLIFFTLLVKLDFDGLLFRRLADVFPVPVIISDNGIIEYYKYKDLKEEFYKSNKDLTNSDFKVFLIKKMIISELAYKYNIGSKFSSNEALFKEIESKVVFDNNINQVAINRIRKISQLMSEGGDFMRIATRYGDAQGLISIEVGSDNKFNNFKTDLTTLKRGEISRIEYATDGYYVFQSVSDDGKNSHLNYVYIKAKSLDEHIKDEVVMYRLWSFVD